MEIEHGAGEAEGSTPAGRPRSRWSGKSARVRVAQLTGLGRVPLVPACVAQKRRSCSNGASTAPHDVPKIMVRRR